MLLYYIIIVIILINTMIAMYSVCLELGFPFVFLQLQNM